MKWFVLLLFFAALVIDTYIYCCLVSRRFRRFGARVSYVVFALVTDGAALTALILYGAAADKGSSGVVTVMWLVWLFFLTFVPKLFVSAGGMLDFLVNLAVRRRVCIFKWFGLVLSAVAMVVMMCGATVGRTRLRVEEVEVCSERVPEAFDGYRIIQFSDIHIGTMLNPGRQAARLVDAINALEGDIVVNTGDLVNLTHDELNPGLVEILSQIDAPDGVWSVWGNHDLGFYIRGTGLTPKENMKALSDKMREMGWNVLSDRSTWIRRGADSLLLTGLDYPHDPMLNGHNAALAGVDISQAFAGFRYEPFNIVLSHTPKMWDEILAHGRGDVTLSGHVHSMQMKLRFGGRAWSPAQYMYDRWSGKYTFEEDKKNSVLYINDGIGCVGYPMRIGARGEITVITLKRCK